MSWLHKHCGRDYDKSSRVELETVSSSCILGDFGGMCKLDYAVIDLAIKIVFLACLVHA